MKPITRDQIQLDYTVSGSGEFCLFFVHGAFIDQTYWKAQVEYFSQKFRVVTIDLAGHGKSGINRKDWPIQALGKDVVSVIRDLDLSNVILIGHSLGGDVVLEAAGQLNGTVVGLIGVDNFKNAGTEMPPHIKAQVDQALAMMRVDFPSVSEAFARQALLTPSTPTEICKRIVDDFRGFRPDIGIPLLQSSFSYVERERMLLQQLKLRLNLVNVTYIPTNEVLLAQYAHSGYRIFPVNCTSHYPMIEIPFEFNNALEKTVEDIINQ